MISTVEKKISKYDYGINNCTSGKLASLFAEQVALQPDGIALRYNKQDITYRILDRWSDELSFRILDYCCDGMVGIAGYQGPGVIAAVLATIKAGVGHVFLDPYTPIRRQRRILKDTNPQCILLEKSLDRFTTIRVPRIWFSQPNEISEKQSLKMQNHCDGESLFHIVFTSGTTGKPKGIRISYESVLNRLEWMWNDYPFKQNAVMTIYKSPALVASPWEMLGGLLKGILSVILTRDEILDPVEFVDAIEREGLTHMFLTPHSISGLIDEVEKRDGLNHKLQLLTSGADILPVDLVHRFHKAFPHVTLLNLYGMSETASNVAAYDTIELKDDMQTVPVGKPIANAHITIRDRYMRLLPVGVQGDVYVSGTPLAMGYYNASELTDERFITQHDGSIIYKTGDLGKWLLSLDLVITGRSDTQIKIRGYRIELEEVEATLNAHYQVKNAGVCFTNLKDQDVIIAFITPENEIDIKLLRAYVRDRLPDPFTI